jgi:hypothetical protein
MAAADHQYFRSLFWTGPKQEGRTAQRNSLKTTELTPIEATDMRSGFT